MIVKSVKPKTSQQYRRVGAEESYNHIVKGNKNTILKQI